MKKLFYTSALLVLMMTTGMNSAQAERVCKVTDPTNTPLNIRDQPNGKVINKLRNEREVYIIETSYDDKHRPWVYLGGYYKGEYRQWGWAIREFVSCFDRQCLKMNKITGRYTYRFAVMLALSMSACGDATAGAKTVTNMLTLKLILHQNQIYNRLKLVNPLA